MTIAEVKGMGVGGLFKRIGGAAYSVLKSDATQIVVTMLIPPQYLKLVNLARASVRRLEEAGADNNWKKEEFVRIIAGAAKDLQLELKGSDYDALLTIALKEMKGEADIQNDT
jgi:hypothetical protein